MNPYTIKSAAETIAECETALAWFHEYGEQMTSADVRIQSHFAGACSGSKEASNAMSRVVLQRLQEIRYAAVADCEQTIARCKEQIRQEVEK